MRTLIHFFRRFSSKDYWNKRYLSGGNSGPGSYNHLAAFKAEFLNKFILDHEIKSVIEFGCGDGNQLTLAQYQKYTGYDISPTAIELCRNLFEADPSKEFQLFSDYDGRKSELTISLDVIFHLTEDRVFTNYMHQLFSASSKFVIIYSSNQDQPIKPYSAHVKHRQFSKWVKDMAPQWKFIERINNPYPYNGDSSSTSFSDFYVYKKE